MNLFPKQPSILQSISEFDEWPKNVTSIQDFNAHLADYAKHRLNVKDFGAKGDGVTDDTAAINAAIQYLGNKGGGFLFFPAGTYVTQGGHILPDYVSIVGKGLFATIIQHTGNNTCFKSFATGVFKGRSFKNFSLCGNNGDVACGINFGDSAHTVIRDLHVRDYVNGTGIRVENLNRWTEETDFINVHVRNCKKGIHFKVSGSYTSFCGTKFLHCTLVPGANQVGLYIDSNADLYASTFFIKGNLEGDNAKGIYFAVPTSGYTTMAKDCLFHVFFEGVPGIVTYSIYVEGGCYVSGIGVISAIPVDKSGPRVAVNYASAVFNINRIDGVEIIDAYPASDKYYYICTLPPSSTNTRDKVKIELIGGAYWDAPFGLRHDVILLGNRERFTYKYYKLGVAGRNESRIVAYQQADGSVEVYLKNLANTLTATLVKVTAMGVIYTTSTIMPGRESTTAPSGTLVFDSATYTPNTEFCIGMLKLSNSNRYITETIRYEATWDPPSLANGASATLTIPAPGATYNDFVIPGASASLGSGIVLSAHVTDEGNINLILANLSGVTVDLPSMTFYVLLIKTISA